MFKLFIAEKLCKCSRKTWLDRSVSPLRILIFLGNQTNMHWIIFLSKDFCIAKITLVLIHFTMVREYLFFLIWCQRLRRWFIWLSCTFGWHQFQNMGYLFMDSIVECTEHTKKNYFDFILLFCQILNTQTSENVLTFVWQLWRLPLPSFEFYLMILKNLLSIKEIC